MYGQYGVNWQFLACYELKLMVKQVTTLPWHFTPKRALFGPIYGIYVG